MVKRRIGEEPKGGTCKGLLGDAGGDDDRANGKGSWAEPESVGTGRRGMGYVRASRAAPGGVMGAWGAVDSCSPNNFFEGVGDGEVP